MLLYQGMPCNTLTLRTDEPGERSDYSYIHTLSRITLNGLHAKRNKKRAQAAHKSSSNIATLGKHSMRHM